MDAPDAPVPKAAYPARFRSERGESYKIHCGPAPRRLADVPRLSFREGVELGGQVLWEEDPREVRAKQRAPMYASVGLGALVAVLGGIPGVITGAPGPWVFVLLSGVALVALGPAISRLLERKGWHRVTPVRLYAHGISLGGPDGPYLPFDGLFAVEVAVAPKWATDFTHLTFIDGSEVTVAFAYFKTPGVVVRKEYKRVKAILQDKFPRWSSQRLDWAADADKFISGLHYLKGPVRLQIEALAVERGLDHVDLAFIRDNWRTIGEHRGLGIYTFKGQALTEFGNSAPRR